jgi:signal transduction histidine kinase
MLLSMLRAPAEDRPQPTLGDVPALVEQSRLAGADITFTMTGDDEAGEDDVPGQTGRHAYRIVQEALTNALKHAPGARVRVEVDVDRSRGLDLRVGNDLVWDYPVRRGGAEAIPGAGAGLAGLRERVQLVGGRLEHGPTPAGEFSLRAWLPWQT